MVINAGYIKYSEAFSSQKVTKRSSRISSTIAASLLLILFFTVGMINVPVVDSSVTMNKVVSAKNVSSFKRYKSAKNRYQKREIHLFLRDKIARINPKTNNYRIASKIVRESKRYGYDPIEIASVIKIESAFNTEAKSYVGATGLMQLMPKTAKYISDKKGITWRGYSSLEDPSYNLRLGIAYYDYLNKKFHGNRFLSLMAYNWGPGNVIRAAKSFDRKFVGSVEDYAFNIMNLNRKWRRELRTRS